MQAKRRSAYLHGMVNVRVATAGNWMWAVNTMRVSEGHHNGVHRHTRLPVAPPTKRTRTDVSHFTRQNNGY